MRAIVVREVGSFVYENMDHPEPAADEVVLKVAVTGLCRTDLKLIRVGHRDLVTPRVPGEEVVGTICETGAGVTGFAVGQRVYVYPGTSCGRCEYCRKGAENLCRGIRIMGFHRDGGFAEYVAAPAKSLIPLPDKLTNEEAVFAEPLSCCLNALELSGLRQGENIGIWGAGPAGTLLYRAAAALGAVPTAMEPDRNRRDRIHGISAPADRVFDVCIIATGSAEAYSQALSRLNKRGRLVVFSGLPPGKSLLPVDFNQFHYHEQTIVGAYGCAYRHGQLALEFIESGKVAVSDLISHRLPLSGLEQALEMVATRQCMKILLYPQEHE